MRPLVIVVEETPPNHSRWRRCDFPGCTAVRWKKNMRRCREHYGLRVTAKDRGERPGKPYRGVQWCTPCQRYVDSPLHFPEEE
jgi:hypothetical protein